MSFDYHSYLRMHMSDVSTDTMPTILWIVKME